MNQHQPTELDTALAPTSQAVLFFVRIRSWSHLTIHCILRMFTYHMDTDFLASLRRQEERLQPPPEKRSRLRTWLRRVGIFFSVLIALVILVTWLGTIVFMPDSGEGWYRGSDNHVSIISALRNLITHNTDVIEGAPDDRINILMLGMGGLGHDGPYLTDTIILASIKPSTKSVALTSVPRDLTVPIPGHGDRKVNEANHYGEIKDAGNGAELARKTLEHVTGQTIHYYVRVDFAGFERLIDEVGGVDIQVERGFTDKGFPAPNDEYQTISFASGLQHMNGRTALNYARSRHGNNGEGSDFARSRRQQKVIVALKEKLLSVSTLANPAKLSGILDTLSSHLVTNIDLPTGLQIGQIIRDIDTSAVKSLSLSDAPGNYLVNASTQSGYYLYPRDRSFGEIRQAVEQIFDETQTPTARIATSTPVQTTPAKPVSPVGTIATTNSSSTSALVVAVRNGTYVAGLAARIQAQIEGVQVPVSSIDNADNRPYTTTVVYDLSGGKHRETANRIATRLNATVVTGTPPTSLAPGTSILVIVGTDAVN